MEKDQKLIAKCGLYCGNCRKYINKKCPGCAEKTDAQWCKVRTCVIENKYNTCADCVMCKPEECKKLNNFVAKVFSLIFRSDRNASINFIKENGANKYIDLMVDMEQMCIKKK